MAGVHGGVFVFALVGRIVADVAKVNMVLIYDPDPRWYVTEETDAAPVLRRRWYRLWWKQIVERETTSLSPDELRMAIEAEGLDPSAWRTPTEAEKQG